jgi:hypothetical protein
MGATNGKDTTRVTAPAASNTPASNTPASNKLSVNVFTAPGKTMVGERPRPFGEAFGFDPYHVDFNLRRVRRGAGGRNGDGG